MVLLLPLRGEGCSFEFWFWVPPEATRHCSLQLFHSHTPVFHVISLSSAYVGSTGWRSGECFYTLQDQVCLVGCLGWGSRHLEVRGTVFNGLWAFLFWSELLRTPTVSPLLRWLASWILSEAKGFGRLHVQCALLLRLLLQGQSI